MLRIQTHMIYNIFMHECLSYDRTFRTKLASFARAQIFVGVKVRTQQSVVVVANNRWSGIWFLLDTSFYHESQDKDHK